MTTQPKYQDEPTHLRDPIWERGQIEPWELLRICAWKSAKNLALLSLNDPDDIRIRTRNACDSVKQLHDASVVWGSPGLTDT